MWKAETTAMSSYDDSSTVLSIRGSDGGHNADVQTEKHGTNEVPELYGESPYTNTDIISLDVGLSKTRYRIHQSILAQCPELATKPALKLWGEKTHDTVALPELDAVTAHTLISFLYTGRYETLQWLGSTDNDTQRVAAYKLATCVYCAAVRYKMPTLAELAQDRIAAEGSSLAIEDVLGVARDCAFPILPEEETWFAGYLEGAIKSAAGTDPGLFMRPGFVDQIEGDRRFRQVVMRAIVSTYSGGMGGGDHPPMDSTKGEEDAVEVAPDEAVAEPVHEEQLSVSVPAINADDEDSVHLDAIEPAVPESPIHRPTSPYSPPAPESVIDELDFKNSKTYQNMGKPVVSHARHDSVVQEEGIAPADDVPKGDEGVASSVVPDVASPASEAVDATEAATAGKKKKSKKGKKKSGTVFA